MESILHTYARHQILTFMASPRCCQQLSSTLGVPECSAMINEATKYGMRVQKKHINGLVAVNLCKRSCKHYLEFPMKISFAEGVERVFTGISPSNFFGSTADLYITDYANNINKQRPKLPQLYFHIGWDTPYNPLLSETVKRLITNEPIYANLNKSIKNNKITLVNSSLNDLSNLVPHIVLTQHKIHSTRCRILVVETEPLLANYNSYRAAALWGEPVGHSVGCQYALYSCLSENSLIIYSTAEFVLRTLMGKNPCTFFSGITHIVVADVQLQRAITQVLLCELRNAIKIQLNLKIILLSHTANNNLLMEYWNRETVFEFNEEKKVELTDILYLEEIKVLVKDVKYEREKQLSAIVQPNDAKSMIPPSLVMDDYLNQYRLTGSSDMLTALISMAIFEGKNINYQHSVTGASAMILAAHHANAEHIKLLLQHNANPFLTDYQGDCAVSIVYARNNADCMEVLNHYRFNTLKLEENYNASFIDFDLLVDIVALIMSDCKPGGQTTTHCFESGNIFILLSTVDDLLKMEYRLLMNRHLGLLPPSLKIHLVHEHISREQLDDLQKESKHLIVLTTEVGELIYFPISFPYVIDTGRVSYYKFNNENGHRDTTFYLISKERLQRRCNIINNVLCKNRSRKVFRLFPQHVYDKLPDQDMPEMSYTSLEKVCLTIKLLTPHKTIDEYLTETLVVPTFNRVNDAKLFLKKIGVLNELEDVTWLGVRIIDIPLDVQLAKMLIYSILLQCMDPIVTMVTFMAHYDRLIRSDHFNDILSRISLTDGTASDHYLLLRVYQEWQNHLMGGTVLYYKKILQSEHKYIMDGLLIYISEMRNNLVAALRAAHLVHSHGCFSMSNINERANCWPLVKAVIVAGLYPHVVLIDPKDDTLKSIQSSRIILHPETVMYHAQTSKSSYLGRSPWMIYSKCYTGPCANAISGCTSVSNMALLLFSGSEKTYPYHISQDFSDMVDADDTCQLYLDEWLWFIMKENEAISILKLRKYLSYVMNSFLKDCENSTKLREFHASRSYNTKLFTSIQHILVIDDDNLHFKQPLSVGIRPKAIEYLRPTRQCGDKTMKTAITNRDLLIKKKMYFLKCLPENHDKDDLFEWLQHEVANVLEQNVLAYYFLFNTQNLAFQYVFMHNYNEYGKLELRECFRNDVPMQTLKHLCNTNKLQCEFNVNDANQLDESTANLLLHIFAYIKNYH